MKLIWRGPVMGAMKDQARFGWIYFFYGITFKRSGIGILRGVKKEGQ